MSDQMTPPPPLEWHPAYRYQTWLLDWLEGRNPELHPCFLKLPKMRQPRFEPLGLHPTHPVADDVLVLTREKAWGAAPYVGRPFVYFWWVATDQLGRSIAGESQIAYVSAAELLQRGLL